MSSAYNYLIAAEFDRRLKIWDTIWKWKGPQRIRVLLWLVCHEALITNDLRARRGLSLTGDCHRCGDQPERVLHSLRDCPKALSLWHEIVPDRFGFLAKFYG